MSEKWAPLYYGTHTGVSGDIDFYLGQLTASMRILELGCGAGRLTDEFLRAGHQVVAVDQSAYGVQEVRRLAEQTGAASRLVALRADFQKLPITGHFDCVVLSFNALLCLELDAKNLLLETVWGLLKSGGVFLFDLYDGTEFLAVDQTDVEPWVYEPEYIRSIEHGSLTYDIYQSGTFYPAQARIIMNYDHFLEDSEDPDVSLRYEINHHVIALEQVKDMLTSVGFEIDQISKHDLDGSTHLFFRAIR